MAFLDCGSDKAVWGAGLQGTKLYIYYVDLRIFGVDCTAAPSGSSGVLVPVAEPRVISCHYISIG